MTTDAKLSLADKLALVATARPEKIDNLRKTIARLKTQYRISCKDADELFNELTRRRVHVFNRELDILYGKSTKRSPILDFKNKRVQEDAFALWRLKEITIGEAAAEVEADLRQQGLWDGAIPSRQKVKTSPRKRALMQSWDDLSPTQKNAARNLYSRSRKSSRPFVKGRPAPYKDFILELSELIAAAAGKMKFKFTRKVTENSENKDKSGPPSGPMLGVLIAALEIHLLASGPPNREALFKVIQRSTSFQKITSLPVR